VSWSGSEIESVGAQEQPSRLSWASEAPSTQQELAPASSLFGAPAAEQDTKQAPLSDGGLAVQPPKTPLGKPLVENEGGLSAAQRVRMELSTHAGSRAGSRANSSENVFAVNPPAYDEEKNGPQSCPSAFNNLKQAQFSLDKIRAMRSNELVASKLLPTRTSVNSLMGYVRELQLSEATLRKQLVKTKQHTEEELTQSLSKVSELERSMQEVERDREMAKRKLEEQEQLIRDLAAKLKQAEAAKTKITAAPAVDELPPIAEEVNPQAETEAKAVATEFKPAAPPAPVAQSAMHPVQQQQASAPPVHPGQAKDSNRAAQFGLASPRSPNRPLWDPWASGGATPMKNLPPVFTIGSTGLDPVVASSTSARETSQTNSSTTAGGEYELKSVLMSPRRVQEAPPAQELEHTAPTPAPEEFTPQYPASMFNVGAMPSSPYPQQQEFVPPETQDEAYGVQSQEEVPLMESPSQAVPMLPVETMAPAQENSFEQQELSGAPAEGNAVDYNATAWNGMQAQEEASAPATSSAPPVGPGMESSASADPTTAEHPSELPPPAVPVEDGLSQDDASQTASPFNESVQPQEVPYAESADTSASAAPPVGPPPPPVSDVSKPRCSPALKEKKAAPAEPVSLETLLVDFFTEVDKKRLKMAKVYGKRYAGREKWLFAELTKRYGAAKVSSLKARFEAGSGAAAAAVTNGDVAAQAQSKASSTTASDQLKPSRQGHPRHPQFFHPPAPASNVDLSAEVPAGPPQAPSSQENDGANSQGQQATEGSVTPPSPSGKVSPGRAARVSPRQRRSGGNIPPFGAPPASFSLPQGPDEANNAVSGGGGMNDLSVMNGPPPSTQREELLSGQFKQPPPPLQNGVETSNAAPMGLRQRHNASGPTAQGQKTSVAEPPSVTLEGLLKELYKRHQPDKLKNVSIVAKQYAGKERELVGLLKGKYGALSVKQLEENLEVLERVHRERTNSKGPGKKRGCFVRTISLVFWLSVLLYFSLGAVFVSFVLLDAWECRALDSEEQEPESEECAPLRKELDAFTYERVGDYVSQSHPNACFCSEWKAREGALLSSLSGDDVVNLARLVPFSPDSFGEPWVATVKEQVPSQEFYESYAKPVVDLSLDVGSFVWSSGLELAGYDEASEKADVVQDAVETDTTDLQALDEGDAHVDSLEHPGEEVEGDMLGKDEDVSGQLSNDAEVDVDSVETADVVGSEQVPMEENAKTSEEELQLGESDAAAEADVAVVDEDAALVEENDAVAVEEEAVPVGEESYPLASEADADKSLGEVESEDAQPIEEAEPIEDSQPTEDAQPLEETESDSATEAEPIAVSETEVEVSADESMISATEEVDSTGGDDDEASFTSETEVDSSVADEEASEVAAVETEGTSGEDKAAAPEDVVEVEVYQEGLDLSYSDQETAVDETESADSMGADEEPELALADDAEVLSVSDEAEAAVTESSEGLQQESAESAENVADEDSVAAGGADDASTPELESDVGAPNEGSEVETENAEAESSSPDGVEVEPSTELVREAESAAIGVDSESSAPTDALVPALVSEEVVGSLSEEAELEGREDDVVIPTETELEAKTPSNEEVNASEENFSAVEDEEELIKAEAEEEPSSSSSDNAVGDLLVEEDVVSSREQSAMGDDQGDDYHEELVAPGEEMEPVAEEVDESLEEVDVVSSTDDVDESATSAVGDAVAPELELEGDAAAVSSDEGVEQELAESVSESPELKEDVKDAAALQTETAGEERGVTAEDTFASPTETTEESTREEIEDADAGNDEASPSSADEVDVERLGERVSRGSCDDRSHRSRGGNRFS